MSIFGMSIKERIVCSYTGHADFTTSLARQFTLNNLKVLQIHFKVMNCKHRT